jgi:2-polyprenyl-6-hydroxyphenyl methylase/3-demethylubiquinone-9 3-methyltransferase
MANDLQMYDERAADWWTPGAPFNALKTFNAPRFAFFDRFLTEWQGAAVLDVGCGGGLSCEFLAARGALVSGIDLSSKSIAAAAAHAGQQGYAIDYRQGRAEQLPYGDLQFDVVVCVDVLEHVSDLRQTLREIHRVLKPGGWFFFDTLNRTWKSRIVMIWLMEYLLRKIPQGLHDWKLFIKPVELRQHLANAGFPEPVLQGFDFRGIDPQTGEARVSINDDLSVFYIGTVQKPV